MISQILTVFKADTSDMKAKIKDLQGEQAKLAKAEVDAGEQRNKSIDAWSGRLVKAAAVLGTVAVATKYASDALKTYGEEMRLQSAIVDVDVAKLQKSFGGLITHHQALTMAAQTQAGAFRLNQGEMETLGKAAVALRNRGFDLEEAFKKLTDAAVKGKTDGLDDFNISVKEGATKAETLKNFMAELNRVIGESGGVMNKHADEVQQLSRWWDDASRSVEIYTAKALIAAGQAFDWQGALRDRILQDNVFYKVGEAARAQGEAAARLREEERKREVIRRQREANSVIDMEGDGYNYEQAKSERERRRKAAEDQLKKDAEAYKNAMIARAEAKARADAQARMIEEQGYGDWRKQGIRPGSDDFDMKAQFEAVQAKARELDSAPQRYQAFMGEQNKSFLEKTFGPVDQFDLYAQGFQMLTGGVTAAMDAWITGSMSASQAIKKFLAESIKAVASQMAVEALKHGAYAIGYAAFGDPRASMHAAAAGKFAAGAAIAGVVAKSLHSSGGGAQTASAAGGGSAGGTRDQRDLPMSGSNERGKDTRPIQIIVGEWFAEESPRSRRQKANDALEKALRERDE